MANRIQLRRDHSTNWTRVNPILSDGEPGLEIDTNKIKYGDGSTAWRDLSYASGGGATDRLTAGNKTVILDTDGNLTLPTGGSIYGQYFIGGEGTNVQADQTANQVYIRSYPEGGPSKEWAFDNTGNLTIPTGGDILRNGTSVLGGSVDHLTIRDSNDISLDGGTHVWNGSASGASVFAGFQSPDTVHTSLFTFSSSGSQTMSVQMDGSLFVGDTLPSNSTGVTADLGGWVVASGGGKFGGDINTLGGLKFDNASSLSAPGGVGNRINLWPNDARYAIGINGETTWVSSAHHVKIFGGDSPNIWDFNGNNGVFYLPNASYIQPSGQDINWGLQGNFNLLTNDASNVTTKTFRFDTDGVLTLPSSGAITTTPGYVGGNLTLYGLTAGANTQLTVYSHPFSSGDKVLVRDISQPTNLNNNIYYARVDDADHITLFTDSNLTQGVNSTGFDPYTYNSARTIVNSGVAYSTDSPYYTQHSVTHSWNPNQQGSNGDGTIYTVVPVFDGWQYSTTGWAVSGPNGYFQHLLEPLSDVGSGLLRVHLGAAPSGGSFYPDTYTIAGGYATPIGGSMLFDGNASLLQVKNDAVFAPTATTPWTLEFFAKYTTTLTAGATLFSIGAAANPMFALRVASAGYIEIVLNGSAWSTGTYANANYGPFGPNDWRHVAIVNNGSGTLSVFYNGLRLALETPVSFNYNFTQTFAIGGSSADGTFGSGVAETGSRFPGLIRDFRFVNGTAVYDPTHSTLTVPTAPLDTTPTVTELYIIATNSSTFAIDTTTTEAHTGGGHVAKEFASADLLLEVGSVTTEDPGHVVLKSGDNQLKWGGAGGGLVFPDTSVQTSAYSGKMAVLPPLTAWGTTISIDTISFVFDGTTGVPGLNGGYGLGAGAYNTLIWTSTVYQSASTPTNYTIGVNSPVQYFNYDGAAPLTNSTPLQPGDYAEVKIQDIGTNKLYKVTFMGAYNPADNTNPTHYGSIAVERLI